MSLAPVQPVKQVVSSQEFQSPEEFSSWLEEELTELEEAYSRFWTPRSLENALLKVVCGSRC